LRLIEGADHVKRVFRLILELITQNLFATVRGGLARLSRRRFMPVSWPVV